MKIIWFDKETSITEIISFDKIASNEAPRNIERIFVRALLRIFLSGYRFFVQKALLYIQVVAAAGLVH